MEKALPHIISMEVLPSIPGKRMEGMEVKDLKDGNKA